MNHRIELIWFSDCPNHATTREMLNSAVSRLAPGTPIDDVDAGARAAAAGARGGRLRSSCRPPLELARPPIPPDGASQHH